MKTFDYLKYTSKTPMTLLRKKFNNNEDIYKEVPDKLSRGEALEDIAYVKYVFENAYSGYSYFDKTRFDNGFKEMFEVVNNIPEIRPDCLIDLICSRLSFILDGHLSFTTREYGKGFYSPLRTFVSDIIAEKAGDDYFDVASGKKIELNEEVQAFPTLKVGNDDVYMLGARSRETIEKISVRIDGTLVDIPVHGIKSKENCGECLINERYDGDTAIISCSSFVGERQEDLDKFYNIGIKCRNFRHVIWDLSNNMGGNSEFPKRFLTGLYGIFNDSSVTFELQSSLVNAKETGTIKNVPYRLKRKQGAVAAIRDQDVLFGGNLHVIVNNMVASSAELAIAWAKTYPHVTFYGCNSLGIGRFGDLHIYYLPNSNIVMWCPQKVFEANIRESVGASPDYWIDSRDVVHTVLRAIARENVGLQQNVVNGKKDGDK